MGKQHDLYDEGLFDRVKDYVGTSVELVKLNAIDKSATVISALVASLILAVVGFFFIFFLSVSVGLFLGHLMSSSYLGFGIVALFYLIILIVVMLIQKTHIQNPISNLFIRKIFNKEK